jgi:hypothetical protein
MIAVRGPNAIRSVASLLGPAGARISEGYNIGRARNRKVGGA